MYNSLTRKKEEFKPASRRGQVSMYVCGPTVYGPGHLGHARTYVNFDLLRRALIFNGFKVKHVMNITDIHDDMIKQAKKEGVTILELADKYIPLFKQDLADLNILAADVYPRVTEHIDEIIKMIKQLIDKDYAYVEKDGSVYYRVREFKKYGRLSGRRIGEGKTGTRVKTDKYEREQAADFVLWKGIKPGEPSWDSPWGKGRPGWHIECSVMAKKHLGETIDIHAGAMDLKFPHHENEIAQSEAANGKRFVNYWLHAGLLDIEGKKMSKSLANFIEIKEIKAKGFEPLALRYLFLTSHYRAKMNFTWQGLAASQKALNRLRRYAASCRATSEESELGSATVRGVPTAESLLRGGRNGLLGGGTEREVQVLINNDLDAPGALAWMWQKIKDKSLSHAMIKEFDKVLGLRLTVQTKASKIPAEIKKLAQEREELRRTEKWQEADEVREKILKIGYALEDTSQGTKVKKA